MSQRTPLQLSHDDMQALGAQALDLVIRHFETNREQPVAVTLPRAETERLLRTALPEEATPVRELVELLERDVFPNAFKSDHPRFYAFVPSPTNFVSVIGDLLISGHNLFAGHWMAASAAGQIEITVIDWLNELVGFPVKEGGGILVSGGSMANLSAIATAREARLGGPNERAVVYCSDQTHSSMAKGLRMLGFRPAQKRTIATDDALPALDARARGGDRGGSRRGAGCPFCVVANGGTTNTGAVDPLGPLADLCAREQLWLHVDGAYGAAAVITERGRAALQGIERADSITLDPHKWLFQPYELGCLLVRDSRTLQEAFRVEDEDHADYLADVTRWVKDDVNFYECGIQLTRSFKALKLWLSMRAFGLGEFRRAIEHGFEMADHAERTLRRSGAWEIVTPSQMGVVTFRWRDAGQDGCADRRDHAGHRGADARGRVRAGDVHAAERTAGAAALPDQSGDERRRRSTRRSRGWDDLPAGRNSRQGEQGGRQAALRRRASMLDHDEPPGDHRPPRTAAAASRRRRGRVRVRRRRRPVLGTEQIRDVLHGVDGDRLQVVALERSRRSRPRCTCPASPRAPRSRSRRGRPGCRSASAFWSQPSASTPFPFLICATTLPVVASTTTEVPLQPEKMRFVVRSIAMPVGPSHGRDVPGRDLRPGLRVDDVDRVLVLDVDVDPPLAVAHAALGRVAARA